MVNRTDKYQYNISSVQKSTLDMVPRGARRILDLGGGSGNFTLAIARECSAKFVATVDISEEAIAAVEPEIDFAKVIDLEQVGAVEGLFDEHGPFDLVLCLDVLEHLVDPWRLVARLHTLLPNDGWLLSSIPNVQNYRVILRALTGRWHYRESGLFDRTHLRFFSRRSAEALMSGTGLNHISYSRTFGPHSRDRRLSRVSLGLLDPWVTMQHLILVQKKTEEIRDPGAFGDKIEFS